MKLNRALLIQLASVLLGVWALATLISLLGHNYRALGSGHPDFYVFWQTARLYLQGQNVYAMPEVTSKPELMWLYPLSAVHWIRWAAYFPFETASLIWLLLKSLSLAWAVILLGQRFRASLPWGLILWTVLVAWGHPLQFDFWNGNFVTLEWFLMIFGTLAWIEGRKVSSIIALGLSTTFKILPIGYALGLLISELRQKRILRLFAGVLIWLVVLGLSFQGTFSQYRLIFAKIPELDVHAWLNDDFSHQSFRHFFFRLTNTWLGLGNEWYRGLGWVGSLSMVGVLAYFRKELLRLDREWKAALVWISFSLALPRSKDYNLVALVFPTLVWCKFAIAEWTHSRTHRREIGMGGAIIFLSAWGGQNRHAENFVTFLYSQKKFILEFTFWILCLRLALRSSLTNSNDQKPQPN